MLKCKNAKKGGLMRINNVNNQQNFGASVKVNNQFKDMLKFGPLKNLNNQLKNSGTNNVYELGKATYTNPQKTNGKHEILLNGEKIDDVVQNSSDGTFSLMKSFLEKCVEKENSLLPKFNEEIAAKLDKVKATIKETGLSIENVKKWL